MEQVAAHKLWFMVCASGTGTVTYGKSTRVVGQVHICAEQASGEDIILSYV